MHRNLPANGERFLSIIAPYRHDLVVAVECIFTWYWLGDLCAQHGIAFVLSHALYMKAIDVGKARNDKIDSQKIALLMKGGMLPKAYVYPAEMRATRDLLRRRNHLVQKHAELLAHIQNTNYQYNLDAFVNTPPAKTGWLPVTAKTHIKRPSGRLPSFDGRVTVRFRHIVLKNSDSEVMPGISASLTRHAF